jgi:hypothetical protein
MGEKHQMAEEASTAEATETTDAAQVEGAQVEAVEAEQEPDDKANADKWKALARKHESEKKALLAEKKTLSEKARRFDEFEESQKSEMQKATDRAVQAEKRAAELEAKTLRMEVSSAKKVPADLLTGSTVEELTASAERLLEFASANTRPAGASGANFAGSSGESAKQPTSLEDAIARKMAR